MLTPHARLDLLPSELLKMVISHLPPKALARLALTCEAWAERVAPSVLEYIGAHASAKTGVWEAKDFAALVDVLSVLTTGENPKMKIALVGMDQQLIVADFAEHRIEATLKKYQWNDDSPFDPLERAKYIADCLLRPRATFHDVVSLAGATVTRNRAASTIRVVESWMDQQIADDDFSFFPRLIACAHRFNVYFQHWPMPRLMELAQCIVARAHHHARMRPDEHVTDAQCLSLAFAYHQRKTDILVAMKSPCEAANQEFWFESLCYSGYGSENSPMEPPSVDGFWELDGFTLPSDAFTSHAGSLDFAAAMVLFDCVASEEQYFWEVRSPVEDEDTYKYLRAFLLGWLRGKALASFCPEQQVHLMSKIAQLPSDVKKCLSDVGFGWVQQCDTLEQAKMLSCAFRAA